jgi:hypothetical protein
MKIGPLSIGLVYIQIQLINEVVSRRRGPKIEACDGWWMMHECQKCNTNNFTNKGSRTSVLLQWKYQLACHMWPCGAASKYILLIDIVSYPFENLIELNTNRWACLKMSAVDTKPVKIRLQIKWSSHGWSHDYRIRLVLRNSWWTLEKTICYSPWPSTNVQQCGSTAFTKLREALVKFSWVWITTVTKTGAQEHC